MAVGLTEPKALSSIQGVRLACTNAKIKRNKKTDHPDLVLIEICEGATVAAAFTQNKFCAAPVTVAREHLISQSVRYLLINSGNANAGTGAQGLSDAKASCRAVAELGQCLAHSVLPFSTGVIGEFLPLNKITSVLPILFSTLESDAWNAASRAIMTTDTVAKGVSRSQMLDVGRVTVTGIAKGSGMIHPNMATMLAYIATDAQIDAELLQELHLEVTNRTFNRITVDGDTSTNDAVVLIASGKSNIRIERSSSSYYLFRDLLMDVYMQLAQAVVRDGEGATKFVAIEVQGGLTKAECLQVANTVALSPLVKTALFASDANWGRIVAAVGRAGIHDLDISKINLSINGVSIMHNGNIDSRYTDQIGNATMQSSEIHIVIDLCRGQAVESVWTCDFSYDYVKINASYRR